MTMLDGGPVAAADVVAAGAAGVPRLEVAVRPTMDTASGPITVDGLNGAGMHLRVVEHIHAGLPTDELREALRKRLGAVNFVGNGPADAHCLSLDFINKMANGGDNDGLIHAISDWLSSEAAAVLDAEPAAA